MALLTDEPEVYISSQEIYVASLKISISPLNSKSI